MVVSEIDANCGMGDNIYMYCFVCVHVTGCMEYI